MEWNDMQEKTGRRPAMLWRKDQKGNCVVFISRDPFFVDDHNRMGFLLEAIRNERTKQLREIRNVLNLNRVYRASF
jgi:hypothetical protein